MYHYEQIRKPDILDHPGSCIITYKNGNQVCHQVNSGHECSEIKKNLEVSRVDYWPGVSCDYFRSEFHNQFSPTPRMVISFTFLCTPNTKDCNFCKEFTDPHDTTRYQCNNCCIHYYQPGIGFFKPNFPKKY